MFKTLLPEAAPGWKVDITTTGSSQAFRMYLGNTTDFTVDWGDNSQSIFNEAEGYKTHSYTNPGTYTLTMHGNTTTINFYLGSPALNNIVTRIQNRINGITGIISFNQMFRQCVNLTGSIPNRMFHSFPNALTFNETFYGCSNLRGPIPSGLFSNNTSCISYLSTFQGCTSLDGIIPYDIFGQNSVCTTVKWAFRNTGLVGYIPENLFASMSLLNDCTGTFLNDFAGTLTGFMYLPTTLFDNNALVGSFLNCFYGNTSMGGIAPELWNRIPVPDGAQCFRSCTSLSNFGSIPSNWK